MKYTILLTLFTACLAQSCTKCIKCTEVSDTGVTIAKYKETCGNWRDVAEFENSVYQQALKTSTVDCVKKSKVPLVGDNSEE